MNHETYCSRRALIPQFHPSDSLGQGLLSQRLGVRMLRGCPQCLACIIHSWIIDVVHYVKRLYESTQC